MWQPLGLDDELRAELLLFAAAPDATRVIRKINSRPLRQDDIWRRLQFKGWVQWLKTVPASPGNERTAREIDVYLRATADGLAQLVPKNRFALSGLTPIGRFYLLGLFPNGDHQILTGKTA